jgi:NADH-quinone oxidoreductase subunit N
VITILAGNLLALLQKNVKRLLAYSSIAHMGYLLVAFIASGSIAPALAVESITFYLVAYFITTLGALGVVSVLSTPQTEADDIAIYSGLFWRRPWLAGAFTLMLLSLAGIPLTAGFIGKFYIFTCGADARLWGLLIAIIVGSGLGLYYYLRIIVVMSMNVETTAITSGKPNQVWISTATLAVLTMLLVMSMNVDATVIISEEFSREWISSSILATLSLLIIWLGIYPNQIVNLLQTVSNTIR